MTVLERQLERDINGSWSDRENFGGAIAKRKEVAEASLAQPTMEFKTQARCNLYK